MRHDPPSALPHQVEGTEFLVRNERAALFDEQGLGKSKQLIDAIVAQISTGNVAGALIVCPNGLKTNWSEEIAKFSGLPVAVFGSGRKARRGAFARLRASFYVINYEAVATEIASLKALLRFKPMALVLDESHRIKTPEARVTTGVLQLRSSAKRRYILSGTPVANKPDDLWSQFYFLDDGDSLGQTFDEFRSRYRGEGGGYVALDDLRDRVAQISKRRLKDHAVALPPKHIRRLGVRMVGRQRELYEEMRNELVIWVRSLDGDEVVKQGEAILARLVRLAQLASNPGVLDASYVETPCKFAAIDGMLDGVIGDAAPKAIIWTSFVENIPALQKRYSALSPVTLHGSLSSSQRDRSVRAFKEDASVRLLVANPAAAREGLTLTQANLAIYLDRTFNLVDYLQSQDRIHRISQTKPCEVILLVAESSIDEFVDFSLEQKYRLAKFVQMDSGSVSPSDMALEKPAVLRALIAPEQ